MSEPLAVLTAPDFLWLCISDDIRDYDNEFPKEMSDVTWATDHCPVACGIGYIRADSHNSRVRAVCKLHDAELTRLRAEVERLTKERDHWKANHDHQVEVKRAIQDRPDLKERAASWAKLNAELTALRAVAEAAGLYVGTETSDVLDVRGSKKAFQELCTALAAWKSASKQEDKG